ncbi:MAG: flippase-like domain-containing protein [Cellulomonas sp.]
MSEQVAPIGRPSGRPPVRPVAGAVELVDTPIDRVHHPGDLFSLVLAALGLAAVLLLAMYARGTTVGVTHDVQAFSSLLSDILGFPMAVLVGIVTLTVPAAVLTELVVRRRARPALEAGAGAVVGLVLGGLVLASASGLGLRGLLVLSSGTWGLSTAVVLAALAGLLTAAGPRRQRWTLRWSWSLVVLTLGLLLVTGQVSLAGVAVGLLVGRVAGLGVRYTAGTRSERAYGDALVDGVRRAGFDPVRLVRREKPQESGEIARASDDRSYELTTTSGEQLNVLVLDGDRQVLGALSRLWRSLRMRGIEGRSFVSLRQAAERAALLAYAVRAAGVRTPALRGMASAQDSMLLVQERPGTAVPVWELAPGVLTDKVLRAVWEQLRLAHAAGIAHRALTSNTVLLALVAGEPVVWLTGWESGDVASSEFARRMDLTQMVALLAARVGAQRALQSASAVLPEPDISAIGPLLQTIALPRRTRAEMTAHRQVLADLRSALVERLPDADVEPERLVRFGARTLLTVILPVLAVVVVLTSINLDQIASTLSSSDWRWSVVAFVLGLLTYVGAGLTFVAFSPVKLSVRSATLVHAVGAYVGIAAPAGIGSTALNLRMLTKRGVSASLAVATVALVQVSQFVVTIALLLLLSIASHGSTSLFTPSPSTLILVGATAAFLAASLLVPRLREWVVARTMPTVRQVWPRLIEVGGHPGKVAVAVGGNVLLTMGYILAFDASLAAFGQQLSLVQVALVYLVGNAAGAVIPTPGGLGTIEVAMIGGLTAAGINPGVAASVVILFRVVTFWLPIPLGWVAMRYLQRTGEL